jgi:hypothetical protein
VAALTKIEEALNAVVRERRGLAGRSAKALRMATLTKARAFLDGAGFDAISHPKDVLIELLQRALLTPLKRPTLEEFRATA